MPAGRSRDGPGQEAMGQQGRRLRAGAILARPSFPSSVTGMGCRNGNGTLSPEGICRELRYDSPPDPERRDNPNQSSGPTPDGCEAADG